MYWGHMEDCQISSFLK